jgi:hypothetical protein
MALSTACETGGAIRTANPCAIGNDMTTPATINVRKVLMDPRSAFDLPAEVIADRRLDRDVKLEILIQWEQDARLLAEAENEGMGGGEPSMLRRVLEAIAALKARPSGEPTSSSPV